MEIRSRGGAKMTKKSSPSDVLEVLETIWELAHAIEARSKRMYRDLGITGPQRLVVRIIGLTPGCNPGEVARRISLDPGTVSRLVTRLVQLKIVRSELDARDRRRQRLTLTARGRTINEDHRGTVEGAVRATLAKAPIGEVRLAGKFIRRLSVAVDPQGP